MKPNVLLIPLMIACVEPPATGAGGEPSGAAAPGAPEPSDGDASGTPAQGGPGAAKKAGPGAVVQEPGPDGPTEPPEMEVTQEQITDGVKISGTLSCDDCSGTLLVRVEDGGANPPRLLTEKSFEEAGPYSILVPKDKSVVLMVVHDADSNGQPTPGEAIGIWTGGLLKSSGDTADVDLAVGVMPDTPPIPPTEEEMAARGEEIPPEATEVPANPDPAEAEPEVEAEDTPAEVEAEGTPAEVEAEGIPAETEEE